jgi:hypothetical protein
LFHPLKVVSCIRETVVAWKWFESNSHDT